MEWQEVVKLYLWVGSCIACLGLGYLGGLITAKVRRVGIVEAGDAMAELLGKRAGRGRVHYTRAASAVVNWLHANGRRGLPLFHVERDEEGPGKASTLPQVERSATGTPQDATGHPECAQANLTGEPLPVPHLADDVAGSGGVV